MERKIETLEVSLTQQPMCNYDSLDLVRKFKVEVDD